MIVQHRSGIPNLSDNPGFWGDPPERRKEALEYALDLQTDFKPVKTAYSVNIPMRFYFRRKTRKGWLNIVNPLRSGYIKTLADASETAEALIEVLRETSRTTGADQFFSQSDINFLASVIYFFSRYESGKYSSLADVLSFLNHDYQHIFKVLFSETEPESLLSTFKSAFDKKAFDQPEGQVGTLKINLSRLATKETCRVFSGDDFNLKISDTNEPSVLVIANDPDTQGINSACYSVVLNRLVRLINKKGNVPASLIIDEVPTFYVHKIENLIATARSNRVSIFLGLQELPQFRRQYGKEAVDTICAVAANVISGSARNKETLDRLEKLFGRVR